MAYRKDMDTLDGLQEGHASMTNQSHLTGRVQVDGPTETLDGLQKGHGNT